MLQKNKLIRDRALKIIASMEYNYCYESAELLKIITGLIKENEKLHKQQEGFIKSLLTDVEM